MGQSTATFHRDFLLTDTFLHFHNQSHHEPFGRGTAENCGYESNGADDDGANERYTDLPAQQVCCDDKLEDVGPHLE